MACSKSLLETGRQHGLTDLSPPLTGVQVARVQPMGYLCDPLIQPGLAKKRAIGLGVMANPLGTFTPREANSRYISPSEAFLPPTNGISSIPMSSNQRILAWVVVAVYDMSQYSATFLVALFFIMTKPRSLPAVQSTVEAQHVRAEHPQYG